MPKFFIKRAKKRATNKSAPQSAPDPTPEPAQESTRESAQESAPESARGSAPESASEPEWEISKENSFRPLTSGPVVNRIEHLIEIIEGEAKRLHREGFFEALKGIDDVHWKINIFEHKARHSSHEKRYSAGLYSRTKGSRQWKLQTECRKHLTLIMALSKLIKIMVDPTSLDIASPSKVHSKKPKVSLPKRKDEELYHQADYSSDGYTSGYTSGDYSLEQNHSVGSGFQSDYDPDLAYGTAYGKRKRR